MACKPVLIVYHANLAQNYERRWVDAFVASIEAQTVKVPILELDYGERSEGPLFNSALGFLHLTVPTHADAQNVLAGVAFDDDYDLVLNTNVDDVYAFDRVAKQVACFEETKADVISSDFYWIDGNGDVISVFRASTYDVKAELARDHNVICHPTVCLSRPFWQDWKDDLCYKPEEIPLEDIRLWQRVARTATFAIVPETLCCHRWHSGSVSERS